MSRKVFIKMEVNLVVEQDDGVETAEIIDELEYSFSDTTGKATVLDTEIADYDIKDSK